MKSIITEMPIEKIVVDAKLYPRYGHSWQVAYDYSESMKTGAKFPLIVVAELNNSHVLVDGKHRIEALKILKQKGNIKVELLTGLSEKEIYLEAIKRNICHGKQFSIQEKINIALKLKDLHYSTEDISQIVQIIPTKLQNLIGRKVTNTITGEEIVLKKVMEHMVNEKPRSNIEYLQAPCSAGSSQEELIRELIVLIESKTLDKKNKKVMALITKLKQALKKV